MAARVLPPVLQRNERAIFQRMRPLLRWDGLRELMLFGFSDAASLEHKKELALSPYWHTQRLILERLDELFDEMGEEPGRGAPPVAIVAQSLGCQVMSNYIWDAQQPRAYAGIWSAPLDDGVPADSAARPLSADALAAAPDDDRLQHSGVRRGPQHDRADRSPQARLRDFAGSISSIPTTCSAGRSRS